MPFKKGIVTNPNGRPKKNALAQEIFDQNSPEALQEMFKMMLDKKTSKALKVQIYKTVVDKAIKSKSEVKMVAELRTSPLLEAFRTVYNPPKLAQSDTLTVLPSTDADKDK